MNEKDAKITPRLQSFLQAVTPTGAQRGPAEELTARFRAVQAGDAGPVLTAAGTRTEHLVELRIRQWIMHMENEAREKQRAEKARTASASLPPGPAKAPPPAMTQEPPRKII